MYSNWQDNVPPSYWLDHFSIITHIVAGCFGLIAFLFVLSIALETANNPYRVHTEEKPDRSRNFLIRLVGLLVGSFVGYGFYKLYFVLLAILPHFAPFTDTTSMGDLMWLVVVGFSIICMVVFVYKINILMAVKIWKHTKSLETIGVIVTFLSSLPAGVAVAILVCIVGAQLTGVLAAGVGIGIFFVVLGGIYAFAKLYLI